MHPPQKQGAQRAPGTTRFQGAGCQKCGHRPPQRYSNACTPRQARRADQHASGRPGRADRCLSSNGTGPATPATVGWRMEGFKEACEWAHVGSAAATSERSTTIPSSLYQSRRHVRQRAQRTCVTCGQDCFRLRNQPPWTLPPKGWNGRKGPVMFCGGWIESLSCRWLFEHQRLHKTSERARMPTSEQAILADYNSECIVPLLIASLTLCSHSLMLLSSCTKVQVPR